MKIIFSLIILLSISACKTENRFNLCRGKTHPYYYPVLRYKGGLYEIKNHFFRNYKSVDEGDNSGIVKIKFNINCLGESGNFSFETFSLEYRIISINPEITQQLIELTKDLNEWEPARNESGNSVNSHKFFAFKIIDGQLKDIFPK